MSVEAYMNKIHAAADMIRERCGEAEIGVILGSGLGEYVNALDDATSVSYEDIPGFPVSTAPGHEGRWCCGTLHGKRVCMMQGRFHSYEGYSMEDVTLPIRVMKLLGVETLIVTNAAGGVDETFTPGDLMLIDDFINLSGKNPLTGPNLGDFGVRFPDMTHAYDRKLQKLAREVAEGLGLELKHGVYCWLNGPTYETPAEIRMTRILGADAVGMSTVPETIVARHSGIKVLGISCITNMAAGILDQPLSHIEVMETGMRVRDTFRALVDGVIAKL
ncbi:MAG: purine-nucleoside phosphorylase [Clostridiales bacterium]|nr:purine-nucleoside phosphorylase [Clostridiales bacterium]